MILLATTHKAQARTSDTRRRLLPLALKKQQQPNNCRTPSNRSIGRSKQIARHPTVHTRGKLSPSKPTHQMRTCKDGVAGGARPACCLRSSSPIHLHYPEKKSQQQIKLTACSDPQVHLARKPGVDFPFQSNDGEHWDQVQVASQATRTLVRAPYESAKHLRHPRCHCSSRAG